LVFGGYVCVHLLANASILGGAEMFQNIVHAIHAPGPFLVVLEWTLIFLPILFHAFIGIGITVGMIPNMRNYPYGANWRYTVQRITGLILFLFIGFHVFHMHGWLHFDAWIAVVEKWGGYQFRPYNAASTAGLALQNLLVALIYAIGVLAAVFHFVNGIWSAGVTWGVWTRPEAQARALTACMALGMALGTAGLGAIWGMRQVGRPENIDAAIAAEDRMYDAKVESGLLPRNEHKRSHPATTEGPGESNSTTDQLPH